MKAFILGFYALALSGLAFVCSQLPELNPEEVNDNRAVTIEEVSVVGDLPDEEVGLARTERELTEEELKQAEAFKDALQSKPSIPRKKNAVKDSGFKPTWMSETDLNNAIHRQDNLGNER